MCLNGRICDLALVATSSVASSDLAVAASDLAVAASGSAIAASDSIAATYTSVPATSSIRAENTTAPAAGIVEGGCVGRGIVILVLQQPTAKSLVPRSRDKLQRLLGELATGALLLLNVATTRMMAGGGFTRDRDLRGGSGDRNCWKTLSYFR